MALWTPLQVASANQGRFFWAGDSATITQVSGEITSWADEFGNTALTEAATHPALYTSGGFGSKAVVRSVNGDTAGAGAAGAWGRIGGSVSDLAGQTNILIVAAGCLSTDSQQWCRLVSIGTGSGNDFDANGKVTLSRNDANNSIQVFSNSVALPSGTGDAVSNNTPFLISIRFDGTNMYWSLNGGSEISAACAFSFVSSGFMRLFADQNQTELWYGDMRSLQIYKGSAVANSTFINTAVGWAAWDATDDGSLLPVGHPYKSAAPTTDASSLLVPIHRPIHHLLIR